MRLSQLAPLPVRRAVWRAVETSLVPTARQVERPKDGPIVVAGMFTTANGLGESARCAYHALKECGLEPLALDTSPILGQGDLEWDEPLISEIPDTSTGFLIVYNNAPELGRILLRTGRRNRRDWCTASVWAWETARRPPGWIERAPLVDELWFPSRFVERAIAPPPPTRTFVAFHPVNRPAEVEVEPDWIAPARTSVFVCYADALSSFTRKNPVGAIRGFKTAFGNRQDVRLIVKTRNASGGPASDLLAREIGDAGNIVHIDRPFSTGEMQKLRSRTDVLVSLHRSEGFGLTIAEAMWTRTPIIATNWSAPTEYLDETCAWLTPASEIPVDDPLGVYLQSDHTWADPDLSVAAEQMRTAIDSPDIAEKKAEAAYARASELFSSERYRSTLGLPG